MPASLYVGRFAPSPSGLLHFGSLITAVASYLQAKSQRGLWLLRIEDIDPPREMLGAAIEIQKTLQAYGLHWDNDVIYQSHRSASYEKVLAQLKKQGLTYYCQCTRKEIKKSGQYYLGTCRHQACSEKNNALRINLCTLNPPITSFDDKLQGQIQTACTHDFILKRKDQLYAYNLAVVVDDIAQGITEVVRGADILSTTGMQLALYQLLKVQAPTYLHLPLAVTAPGVKLSKQNHAQAIKKEDARSTLLQALAFLGLPLDEKLAPKTCAEILKWAIKYWSIQNLPQQIEIQI
ncbi:glutamate--tRNA ligase [Psychromonas sp. CNPT3]|uniref:tRNA glutamyl-Q(34) synthetase GluQRS n=1 Tax=Psychromonas sp. CNPT3 TaxID=314282 RepID=UPI00006E78F3|nr:tRNA glutamyl-Q(34) synthetase GluQRS [Psychromonas sp. CNPT3]AGH82099.1 glutamate--tRNA ligase [Psychromonas sp. CNPT3]